jgi:YggT family protein
MGIAQSAVKRGSRRNPERSTSPLPTTARNAPPGTRPARDPAACGRTGVRLGSRLGVGYGVRCMKALFWLLDTLIDVYIWLLIAQAILSWLLAFGVVNRYNRAVAVIGDFLYRVTEPVLRPIRAFLPNFGGIDISPIILILILMFLRRLILYDIAPNLL